MSDTKHTPGPWAWIGSGESQVVIAGSPRLYEALFNLIDNIEPNPDDPTRSYQLNNGFVRWDDLINAAKDALSKARGGET